MTLKTTTDTTTAERTKEILNAIAPHGPHSARRKLYQVGAMRFTELPGGDLAFNMRSHQWDGVRISPQTCGSYTMKLWRSYRIPAALGAIGRGEGSRDAGSKKSKDPRPAGDETEEPYQEQVIHVESLKELRAQFQEAFLETRFRALAAIWKEQTRGISSTQQMADNQAYREILGIGERAVPLILKELRDNGGHWFHALNILTGARPVPREDRGKVSKMAEAWLTWGQANGHIN